MEHVRLSLAPPEYLSKNVVDEPLFKNNIKCMFCIHYACNVNLKAYAITIKFSGKDFVIEALNFHIVKKHRHFNMPRSVRYSPRQTGIKVLLNSHLKLSFEYHSIYLYFAVSSCHVI